MRPSLLRRASALLLLALVACDASSATPKTPSEPPPAAAALDVPEVDAPEADAAPTPGDDAPAPGASVMAFPSGSNAPAADASAATRPAVHADLDPDNDEVIGPPPPIEDCEERLAAAGITFKPARIGLGRKQGGVYTCGSEQVVRVRRGPGEITYSKSSPLLTCGMALALADFERVAQEEAQRHLGARIKQIDHLGTYNCRKMAAYDLISEHSYANGFDLRRFHLTSGEVISVLEDFRPEVDEPDAPATRFLRALANRLYDEGVFSVVVTPYFDRLHRNHIHVDLARYRVDGSRP
ncbi:MAG: extensin family protein [Myxococcales bacterium]|nr:extensin family protein [Myxococcales bacterium]